MAIRLGKKRLLSKWDQSFLEKCANELATTGWIDRSIPSAQAIYRQNFFPEMKMDWRTHPHHISHKDWDGCFRCHDGKHKTADGQKSIAASDCRSCHIILAQGSGAQLKQLNADGHDFIHVDSEFSDFSCAE